MARSRFGSAIGSESKWRFGAGDIVKYSPSGSCLANMDGVPEIQDGRIVDCLNTGAVCYVVGRVPNPPDAMYAVVSENGTRRIEKKGRCYLVQVIPEASIQPGVFFRWKLGLFYIVKETTLSQDKKEKTLVELGLFNYKEQRFDINKLSDFKAKVHKKKMQESSRHDKDDR